MGLEETVARLREDVTAAQRQHASAAAQAEQAGARAATVREDLESGFGVTTVEAAKAELARLESKLATEAAEVRRQLGLAGGAA
jgi:hypothetical protein